MRRMIGKIIAGFGMREDGETAPVECRPSRERAKLLSGNRELTAPARVRADRLQVEMADRDAKLRLSFLREGQLIGVEIDVGVEILDCAHVGKIGCSGEKSCDRLLFAINGRHASGGWRPCLSTMEMAAELMADIDPGLRWGDGLGMSANAQ